MSGCLPTPLSPCRPSIPRHHCFALALNAAWCLRALKKLRAHHCSPRSPEHPTASIRFGPAATLAVHRESFAVILGELQNRDGSRVPSLSVQISNPAGSYSPSSPCTPGCLSRAALAAARPLAVAYPALRQLLGFRRFVNVRRKDGTVTHHNWAFSGLILDEKGDFTVRLLSIARTGGGKTISSASFPGQMDLERHLQPEPAPPGRWPTSSAGSSRTSTRAQAVVTHFGRTHPRNW